MQKITIFFSLLLSLFCFRLSAQNHVKWETHFDAATSEIVVNAKIDAKWHLYSTDNAENLGPVPTYFAFPKQKGLKLQGKIKEQKPIMAFDPNFGATVGYHENWVEFRQKVKIKKIKSIDFTVSYMVCDDAQCLPPIEVPLQVKMN